MPYDIKKAGLIKEIAKLRRQLSMLPEGAGWCDECTKCEDCGSPGLVDRLYEQIDRERSNHNSAMRRAEESYQEQSWELDSCRSKGQKCRIENQRLKRGY